MRLILCPISANMSFIKYRICSGTFLSGDNPEYQESVTNSFTICRVKLSMLASIAGDSNFLLHVIDMGGELRSGLCTDSWYFAKCARWEGISGVSALLWISHSIERYRRKTRIHVAIGMLNHTELLVTVQPLLQYNRYISR